MCCYVKGTFGRFMVLQPLCSIKVILQACHPAFVILFRYGSTKQLAVLTSHIDLQIAAICLMISSELDALLDLGRSRQL